MSSNWKNNVTKSFGKKSTKYDDNCVIQDRVASNLINDLPKPEDGISEILEIGCGTGNLTKQLLKRYKGQSFFITDISEEMIACAKEKIPDKNIKWRVMDGENPDTSQKYDLIVANMVFQWFEDIESTLDKLKEMLNPNGYIFYTVPGLESFKEWKEALQSLDLPVGIIDFCTPKGIYIQETTEQKYDNAFDFLKSIKDIGAGSAKKDYAPLSNTEIKQACYVLDQKYDGNITWQILYGKIHKPEEQT